MKQLAIWGGSREGSGPQPTLTVRGEPRSPALYQASPTRALYPRGSLLVHSLEGSESGLSPSLGLRLPPPASQTILTLQPAHPLPLQSPRLPLRPPCRPWSRPPGKHSSGRPLSPAPNVCPSLHSVATGIQKDP